MSLLTDLINSNDGTGSTLNKFACDTKPVGVAGAGEPSHRLEKWPDRACEGQPRQMGSPALGENTAEKALLSSQGGRADR